MLVALLLREQLVAKFLDDLLAFEYRVVRSGIVVRMSIGTYEVLLQLFTVLGLLANITGRDKSVLLLTRLRSYGVAFIFDLSGNSFGARTARFFEQVQQSHFSTL